MKKGEGSFGGSGCFEVGGFRRMEFKTLSPFSSFHFLSLPIAPFPLCCSHPVVHDFGPPAPSPLDPFALPVPTSRLSHALIFREEPAQLPVSRDACTDQSSSGWLEQIFGTHW